MKITGKTKILGIFGYPITHTLSPLMHNAAIERLGLDMVYLPFEVEHKDLKNVVDAIRALNIIGVNITIPHKESVIKFLDEVSDDARLIGAVNTIVNKNGKLIGYNTDGEGYVNSLKNELGFDVKGKNIVILGAGGAARGIVFAIAKKGAKKIVIANRTIKKAVSLANEFKRHFKEAEILASGIDEQSFKKYLTDIHLIINTTSIGMNDKGDLKIPFALIPKNAVVSDIVYKPLLTKFLKNAERFGIKTHSGLGMLVEQGALSFKLWTKKDMPKIIVYKTLQKKLARSGRIL
ncbi:MAG: shikimate dehydrogenase [Deltaproteobacteria bacterium]|nr:shikimate dehydrogenase [Deltaproteobacteria bacterium]